MRALLALGEKWRSRELPFFSGLRLEKTGSEPLTLDFAANLAEVAKPFLTVDGYCSFAQRMSKGALVIKEDLKADESFHLTISADDKGKLAPFRLDVFDAQGRSVDVASERSAFRGVKVERPVLQGPTSDEVQQNLRNLGYLGGAAH